MPDEFTIRVRARAMAMRDRQQQEPEDQSVVDQYGRGLVRGGRQLIEAAQEVPGFLRTVSESMSPARTMEAIQTARDVGMSGALEMAKDLPFQEMANEALGGEAGREVPFAERAGVLTTDLATGLGLKKAFGLLRGLRATPAPPVQRRLLPEFSESTLAQQRTAVQEAADRAAGLTAEASRRVTPPAGANLVPGSGGPSVNKALLEALDEARVPQPGFAGAAPQRVGLTPPRFGQRVGGEQPAVSITRGARAQPVPQTPSAPTPQPVPESAKKVLTASRPGTLPGVRRARHAADAPQDPTLAMRAGEGGMAGSRVWRSKVAQQMFDNWQPGVGFRQALEEGAKRGLGPDDVAQHLVDKMRGDAGFAATHVAATIAGAGAGATAGMLLSDDPEARLGLIIMTGLGGAVAAPKLLNFAASEPGRFRQLAGSMGRTIQAWRAEAALSGMAAPKNVGTAIGAPVTAAIEKASVRPLAEAARLPTNIKNFLKGSFTEPIDIGMSTGRPRGKARFFSRLISGIDFQAEEALRRAGLTTAESNRILLKTPLGEILSHNNPLRHALESTPGRAAVLFQRTPTNVFVRAISELDEMFKGARSAVFSNELRGIAANEMTRRRLLTGATLGAGTLAGAITDDMDSYKRMLVVGILASMAGPRVGQFAIGTMAGGAGALAAGGVAPFPEFGFDPRSAFGGMVKPSGVRLLEGLEEANQRSLRKQREGPRRPSRPSR